MVVQSLNLKGSKISTAEAGLLTIAPLFFNKFFLALDRSSQDEQHFRAVTDGRFSEACYAN
jgi:hypothetical protein